MKKLFLSLVLLLAISFSTQAFSFDIQEGIDVGIEQATNDIENVVLSISVITETLDQNTLETNSIDSHSNIVNRQSLILFVISKKVLDNLIKKRDYITYITYNKYLKNSETNIDRLIKSNKIGNSFFYILRSA